MPYKIFQNKKIINSFLNHLQYTKNNYIYLLLLLPPQLKNLLLLPLQMKILLLLLLQMIYFLQKRLLSLQKEILAGGWQRKRITAGGSNQLFELITSIVLITNPNLQPKSEPDFHLKRKQSIMEEVIIVLSFVEEVNIFCYLVY